MAKWIVCDAFMLDARDVLKSSGSSDRNKIRKQGDSFPRWLWH
jgi:hypothetical protein